MREEGSKKIEAHVAGICFDNEKLLVLKRSLKRKLYPGLWECGGGQVMKGESFEDAIKRQMLEESGAIVKPIKVLGTYFIEKGSIPGVRFLCEITRYADGKPKISKEHTNWKLVDAKEIEKLDFIPGLKDNIREAFFKNRL